MINKITFELNDDELDAFKTLIKKCEQAQGEVSLKIDGSLRGALRQVARELHIYDDFKKRDLW
jgi:F0F1-type ATP synthase delta subunit